jgi:hypothetical protein
MVQSVSDRLREFRECLADSENALLLARRTRQNTEALEFIVEKLGKLVAETELDVGFRSA